MLEFKIIKKSKKSRARLGILKTKHGLIKTPCFVPVATQAVIKTLESKGVAKTKTQILICNAFHLHIKTGENVIEKAGGLHKFMNWQGPLMTDSGGFQVFSLGFGKDFGMGKILKRDANIRMNSSNANKIIRAEEQPKFLKITQKGVYFRSFLDGKKLFLGPEESIKIQEKLGADIIFAFDECTSPIADYQYTQKSLQRTHSWARDCLRVCSVSSGQAIFGIVQGGRFKKLRIQSAKFIASLPFDGFGIGGEFGSNKKKMLEMLSWVIGELPEEKPRHLLGIGYPEDILKIIKKGVDLFDCNVPTHYARRGFAFINKPGRGLLRGFSSLNLGKPEFLKDKQPLDKNCSCFVCQNYSRNYISHLFRTKEITGLSLLTFHNLYFFNHFVWEIREKIKKDQI